MQAREARVPFAARVPVLTRVAMARRAHSQLAEPLLSYVYGNWSTTALVLLLGTRVFPWFQDSSTPRQVAPAPSARVVTFLRTLLPTSTRRFAHRVAGPLLSGSRVDTARFRITHARRQHAR